MIALFAAWMVVSAPCCEKLALPLMTVGPAGAASRGQAPANHKAMRNKGRTRLAARQCPPQFLSESFISVHQHGFKGLPRQRGAEVNTAVAVLHRMRQVFFIR